MYLDSPTNPVPYLQILKRQRGIESSSLTEREVSDPDEVGGEWELPEAVGGGEEVPPRDEDGAAPVERRVLAPHPNRRLPRVRAQAANRILHLQSSILCETTG